MRVLVLNPYLYGTAPGARSGLELWERVLKAEGIDFDYLPFETERLHTILYRRGAYDEKLAELGRSYVRFVRGLRGLSSYDGVVISREATLIGPALVERWIASRNIPIIYVLDDPHYIPYRSPANGLFSYLKCPGKVKTLCRMSKVVIANSPNHAHFASRFNGNVWEIPSVVDADAYTGWVEDEDNGRPVIVGWSGSSSTVGNLQLIREPLQTIASRGDVDLRLIGASDFGLDGIPHVATPWSCHTEVAELRRLDVGLVPVPMTRWAPHKFYLKLVQYMALGIPAVATPVGSNPIVIDDGESGFLASSPDEWTAKLQRLVEDQELRHRMGQRAAAIAHQRYTLQANAEKVVAAFSTLR